MAGLEGREWLLPLVGLLAALAGLLAVQRAASNFIVRKGARAFLTMLETHEALALTTRENELLYRVIGELLDAAGKKGMQDPCHEQGMQDPCQQPVDNSGLKPEQD